MRVVSNTSPISNLAIIGRLDFLKRRYGEVRIPSIVARELAALSHDPAKAAIDQARKDNWLITDETTTPKPTLAYPLDAGEAAAIALAVKMKADVLLMDEKLGREAARNAGLKVGGLLGELLHAKQCGWISSLKTEMDRLRTDAGFFIDCEIERFLLSQAGE